MATKTKKLKKPTRAGKLTKGRARSTKVKAPRHRDPQALYKVKPHTDVEEVRSKILQTMIHAGQKLRKFTADDLVKKTGGQFPSKSKGRLRATIAWRLRHSGAFVKAA